MLDTLMPRRVSLFPSLLGRTELLEESEVKSSAEEQGEVKQRYAKTMDERRYTGLIW